MSRKKKICCRILDVKAMDLNTGRFFVWAFKLFTKENYIVFFNESFLLTSLLVESGIMVASKGVDEKTRNYIIVQDFLPLLAHVLVLD